jgi:hypothetical protein
LPAMRAVLLTAGGYVAALRPGYFPIVRARAQPRFRGVVV